MIQDAFYVSAGVTPAWRDPAKDCILFKKTTKITGNMNITIPYHIAYEGNFSGVATTKYYERT